MLWPVEKEEAVWTKNITDSSLHATFIPRIHKHKDKINIVIRKTALLAIAFPPWIYSIQHYPRGTRTRAQDQASPLITTTKKLWPSKLNRLTLKQCSAFSFLNVHVASYCLLIQVGLLKMPQLILTLIVTAVTRIASTLLLCNAVGFANVPAIKIKKSLGSLCCWPV